MGIAQTIIGGIQTIGGHRQEKKAEKALENLQTPTYTKSQSILDYYDKALQRYNVNPYSTNLYKMQANNINRNIASGLSALRDRRSVLGGVNSLVQSGNDASLKAGVVAEGQQAQRFGQLGTAAEAKAGEDRTAFQYNQIAPYEKKYNLLAMKASGGAQRLNAGLSNIFRGIDSTQEQLASAAGAITGMPISGGQSNSGGGGIDEDQLIRNLIKKRYG